MLCIIQESINAQDDEIRLKAEDLQLREIFREIENKSDYAFFFNAQYAELSNKISIDLRSDKISYILDTLLSGTRLYYKILENDFVVIIPKSNMNGIDVSGRITDIAGNPIGGVHIVEKGTETGVISDFKGNYAINVSSGDIMLQFSCIGYSTQEVYVGDQSIINMILSQDVYGLEELVITGYGIQKKSDLTGAISSVSGEKLNKTPVSNIDQALQGRASGLMIFSENGSPGSDIVVRVRGISSINGATPLFVVDGVPLSSDAISALNPNDIESIEILKDASSSAIYGATGGNGVILITTKKGDEGTLVADLNYYYGIQSPYKKLDMMNTEEFFSVYSKIAPPDYYWPADTFRYFPDIDYQERLFRNAPIHRLNFSVSGGNNRSTYWFSSSYFFQEGVIPNSKYNRVTLRLNSSHKLSKKITIGQNLTLVNENTSGFLSWQYNHAYQSPIVLAVQMHPFVEPYDENGEWNTSPLSSIINPFVYVDITDRDFPIYRIIGDINLGLELFKGLRYKTIFGGGIDFRWTRQFEPTFYYNSAFNRESAIIHRESARNYNWSWQQILSYSLTMKNHQFTVMAGMEAGYYLNENIIGERSDPLLETREMHYFDASINEDNWMLNGGGEEVASGAYFGRLIYNYKGKYLFTSNFRKDYSSKFGPNNRSGTFPSISVGWKFTEEKLMESIGFISFGKLRVGWGQTGNSNFRPYVHYALVKSENVYSYPLDNGDVALPGTAPHGITNKEIAWEALEDVDIGLDLMFWENRISFTFDYFKKYNKGMIIEVPTPDIAGLYQQSESNEGGSAKFIDNVGNVENTGVEISAGFKNTLGRLKHSVETNFTYFKNIVGDINDNVIIGGMAYTFTNLNYTAEGYPMGSLYGYVTDGLFRPEDAEIINGGLVVTNQPSYINEQGERVYAQPNAQPGDVRFKDLNNDGNITSEDRTVIGNPHPKYIVGISYELLYKQFDFSMFWQGQFGHQYFRINKSWLYNSNGRFNWHKDVLNRYTNENTDADLFRLDYFNSNRNDRISDWYVEDAGYLRLKNIQLGYTIPQSLTESMNIEVFRIYIGARDLLTFTKYGGLDPEIASNETQDPLQEGIDVATYPRPRVFIFGFNVTF